MLLNERKPFLLTDRLFVINELNLKFYIELVMVHATKESKRNVFKLLRIGTLKVGTSAKVHVYLVKSLTENP